MHIFSNGYQINPVSMLLAFGTVAIIFALPRFFPRLPAVLVAVIVPSLLVNWLKVPVDIIGNIPNTLPLPKLPSLPQGDLLELVSTAFIVFTLASMETLLSSSAVDKLTKSKPHNSDQELIGQGLGNIASALFGGIPVTGVIARSALNIQAGAKTRRAAIFHALILLCVIYFFSTYISKIPIAVLAGVLISVSLKMLNPAEFLMLWRTAKSEAIVYVSTFGCIVLFDLISGIKLGIIIAIFIALLRLNRTKTRIRQIANMGPTIISVAGALTFLSSDQLDAIQESLKTKDLSHGVIIDLNEVQFIDASAATQLLLYLEQLAAKNIKFAVKGISPELNETLIPLDTHKILQDHLVYDEADLQHFFANQQSYGISKLIEGAQKFKEEAVLQYHHLLPKLAQAQNPHTLFIACADSRVNTNLITGTNLGEIFTIRNVGNIIPIFGTDNLPAEGAAIEYALGVLNVNNIVVCGHSGCGAISAIMNPTPPPAELSSLNRWLKASAIKEKIPDGCTLEKTIELNVLLQLEHLRTYPIVQRKLLNKEIQLHGWYFDIARGELREWDEEQHMFVTVGTKLSRKTKTNILAGVQFQSPILEDTY
jgi:carbonic anhydrase